MSCVAMITQWCHHVHAPDSIWIVQLHPNFWIHLQYIISPADGGSGSILGAGPWFWGESHEKVSRGRLLWGKVASCMYISNLSTKLLHGCHSDPAKLIIFHAKALCYVPAQGSLRQSRGSWMWWNPEVATICLSGHTKWSEISHFISILWANSPLGTKSLSVCGTIWGY